MNWTTPEAVAAGADLTSAFWNAQVKGNLDAIGGAWQSWTPTYTNITPGNATVVAKYLQAGKFVIGRFRFAAGSSTTYAAGNLLISAPVPMASDYDTSADALGFGNVNNNTSASRQVVEVMPFTGLAQFILAYTGAVVTNTAPFAFGASSRIGFTFMYEAA